MKRSTIRNASLFSLFLIALAGLWAIPKIGGFVSQMRAERIIDRVMKVANPGNGFYTCSEAPLNKARINSLLNEAAAQLENSLRTLPGNSRGLLLLARMNCLLGKPDQAVDYYRSFTRLRPENPLGKLEMGFAYERLCQPQLSFDANVRIGLEEAGTCNDRALKSLIIDAWKTGSAPNDFLKTGNSAFKSKNYQEALKWYQRALDIGENAKSSYWYTVYLILKEQNQDDLSFSALETAVEADQGWDSQYTRFRAWFQWGSELLANGLNHEAEMVFQRAEAFAPDNWVLRSQKSELYRFLGISQWNQKKYDVAEENLLKAIEIFPDSVWAHLHYGKIIYEQNRDRGEEAQVEFLRGLTIGEFNLNAWTSIADFWLGYHQSEMVNELCRIVPPQNAHDEAVQAKCAH